MSRKATIGSISHGTLRSEDLLDAFAYELYFLAPRDDEGKLEADTQRLVDSAHTLLDVYEEKRDDAWEAEASEIIAELEDALSELAPPYCYFGTTEGDGSDFGFWPDMDAIEDLPRVNDSDEAKALGEDCAFVNDHGNVTVYGGDGSVIIDFV